MEQVVRLIRVQSLVMIAALVACGNDAVDYVRTIEPKAVCVSTTRKMSGRHSGDVAICEVPRAESKETWLCYTGPARECRVLGPVVQVHTTTPGTP